MESCKAAGICYFVLGSVSLSAKTESFLIQQSFSRIQIILVRLVTLTRNEQGGLPQNKRKLF
jgi:hypothetical protein